jgi:hypothetical protein
MAAPKTIEELLKALQSAPQEKEGAFRIGTWKMVLEAFSEMRSDIARLEEALSIVEKDVEEAVSSSPDTDAIKKAIKDDLSQADANKVLF